MVPPGLRRSGGACIALAFLLGVSSTACGGSDDTRASAESDGGNDSGATSGVLASGESAFALVVADGFVYWTYRPSSPGATDGGVRRIALSGGASEDVLTGLAAGELAVASGDVYVIDAEARQIVHAPVTGGEAAALYSGFEGAYSIVADADALYFANGDVLRAPFDGSGLQTLASGLITPLGVAVDATDVYVACDGSEGSAAGPYSDGSFVRVRKVPGAEVEVLVSPVTGGQDVAVAGTRVFFLQFGFPPTGVPGAVWLLDLPGSSPRKVLDGIGPGTRIRTDGVDAYVSGNLADGSGGVFRVTADGRAEMLVPEARVFALGPDVLVYASDDEIEWLRL